MRSHVFVRHPTPVSLVEQYFQGPGVPKRKHNAFTRSKKRLLKTVRSWGLWAFVLIPNSGNEPCEIHFWFRKNKNRLEVAMMIGHELGHIADGGPHGTSEKEERRADEYGEVAQAVVGFLTQA